MALAVIFYDVAQYYFQLAVSLGMAVVEFVALVNCVTQRADAFPVVGSLSKNAWLGILVLSVLVTVGCGIFLPGPFTILLLLAAITAAAVYMLDVRPALRDATNGSGGW